MTETRKKCIRFGAGALLTLLGNIIFFLTVWLLQKYDKVCFDQILYQISTSTVGTPKNLSFSAVLRVGGFTVLATAAEIFLYLFLSGRLKRIFGRFRIYVSYSSKRICSFFERRVLALSLAVLIAGSAFFLIRLDVVGYLYTISTDSDFIEEHYVDPAEVALSFPETKRNLIYIFLESMETTYGDPSAGGPIVSDFMPELTQLQKEHVSFSGKDGMGGFLSYSGATWTAAAMVSQTAGVTVKVPLTGSEYGKNESYMPGAVTLGDILKDAGYRQTIVMGSDAEFACREAYFSQHGGYEILDINALKEAGRLPEDYLEWWGFEDEKMFEFAKEELKELGSGDEPFNLTLLTADTHFPDGYECDRCSDTHDEQYANVVSCSSRQVYEFIEWCKDQPFYENTTIVLSGDHLTMDPEFLDGIREDYVRTTYHCFINAAATPVKTEGRSFGSFDMLPTTLAAMGVRIEGDRLALGTNLFSGEKTLTEVYGYEYLDYELLKESEFYKTKFFDTDKMGAASLR